MTSRLHPIFDWKTVGPVSVIMIRPGKIEDARWMAFNQELYWPTTSHILGLTWGSIGVSSSQRKASIEASNERNIGTTALIDSAVTRGMITAAGWFGIDIKGYSWDDLDEAMKRLPFCMPSHRAEIDSYIEKFYAECTMKTLKVG